MLRSMLLIALAGFTTAGKLGRSLPKGFQANLLLPGANSLALRVADTCSSLESDCDGFCVPDAGATCCNRNDGSYCEMGKYCVEGGCCEDGEICSGEVSGCDDGKELCGSYCIPTGSVCCEETSSYCEEGQTCTSDGFCETGSGDAVGDDKDNDSLDSEGCYSYQDECDGFCIPSGSICCGSGYYCDAGEKCVDGLKCELADSSDSPEPTKSLSGDEDADKPTAMPTAMPTALDVGNNDDKDDVVVDSSDDTKNDTQVDDGQSNLCRRKGGKSGGGVSIDTSDDGCGDDSDAGSTLAIPALLAGVAAIIPLML